MTQCRLFSVILCGLALLCANPTHSTVPQTINHEGMLLDALGNSIADGPHPISFVIYDAPVGGAPLWSSGSQVINTLGGLFQYALGSNVALPHNLFIDSIRYLGITIDVDPELIPRQRIRTTPYTYHALRADTAGIAATVFDNSITTVKLAANAVNSSRIADGSISESDLAANSVGAAQIQNDAVGTNKILDGSVTSADIANSSITGVDIASNTIGQSDISTNGVASAEIQDNTVTTADIKDGTITWTDLASNGVTGGNIVDGSVFASDLVNEAGVATQLNDSFVTISGSVDTKIDSISLLVPTSGFIIVRASAYVALFHSVGGTTTLRTWVSEFAGIDANAFSVITIPDNAATGNYIQSLYVVAFRTVTAGNHKYYFSADGGTQSVNVIRPHLEAQFFPTAYGTFQSSAPPVAPGGEPDATGL